MPDVELLGILRIMCEVVEGQQADRKFNSQEKETIQHSQAAKQTWTGRVGHIIQMSVILIQTCQIISGPAQTEKETKGQADL